MPGTNITHDPLRAISSDQMFYVKVGTASTHDLAKVSLGSSFANYNAEVIAGVESDGTTKTDLPVATINSSGVLSLAEASDGFEDGDKFLVLVTKESLDWESPTMTDAT
jgi:hypothetical protein